MQVFRKIVLTGWLGSSLFAANASAEEILSQYRIVNPSQEQMAKVAGGFEVINRDGNRYDVLVPKEKRAAFLALVPKALLVAEDTNALLKQAMQTKSFVNGYRSFTDVSELLAKLEKDYPELVKLETYGESSQGRPLYVLKVSDNVAQDEEGEPRLLLDAATHGDEIITVEVLLNLLEEMLAGYGYDERLTAMINHTALYFVPVVSPDSFVRQERYVDGVDPNRAYPWPESPNRNPVSCIQALMDLVARHKFAGTMDIHAFGGMVMYPWAYTYEPVDDEAKRSEMAELTATMAEENDYRHGPISEVIYVAKGSSADYYYWKFNTTAIAIEVGDEKAPYPSEISAKVDEVREGVWRFIEHFYP